MYKIINDLVILKIEDESFIPVNEGNKDYLIYLQWLSEGNTPLPADKP